MDVRENGGGVLSLSIVELFTIKAYDIMLKSLYFGEHIKKNPALLDDKERASIFPDSLRPQFKRELIADQAGGFSTKVPFFCQTEQCAASEANRPARAAARSFEVALLTGPDCFSSCDLLVSILKDNAVARLIGMPSGAGDSPMFLTHELTLPSGDKLTFTRLTIGVSYRPRTNGTILEAHPPALDIPLFPTKANRTTYLTSALTALGW